MIRPPFSTRAFIALLMSLLLGIAAFGADNDTTTFLEANRRFEQGQFGDAAEIYQHIAKAGKVSPELLFNLGTAYLKDEQLGRAIAALLAAERLAPRDAAIKRNLQMARIRAGTAELSLTWWQRVFRLLTLNEWTLLAMIPAWALLGLGVVWHLHPPSRDRLRRWITLSGWVTGITVALLAIAAMDQLDNRRAVIAGKQVVARFGPVAESQEAFALADGTETTIEDSTAGWFKVRDGSGRLGWVRVNEVARPHGW
jgi:tetratricopeptide (TPR) repeat protein